MEKEFVPYEQALALKELGFDEPCFGFYNNADGNVWIKHTVDESIKSIYTGDFEAPLYQQAFRWFREKYKLYPEIGLHDREDEKTWRLTISILGYYELAYNQNVGKEPYYKTYEETESACLIKLIEIVKTK